jgi:hypothetical protein
MTKTALALSAALSAATLVLAACEAPETAPAASAVAPATTAPEASVAAPGQADAAAHADFQRFFADFRRAVLADDREAVAGMTHLPFVDYRYGDYCEPNVEDCDQPAEALTSINKAVFLEKYDRIFTPEVVAAIRASQVRQGYPADDNVAPSVLEDEYYINLEDTTQQRVFQRHDGVYKLSRVPFYS